MAEPKTRQTGASVETFLNKVKDDSRRQDCLTLLRIMKRGSRSAA